MANRPKPQQDKYTKSVFDAIPPVLASNMTGKDYVNALKESRWNNDYQTESFKSFLQADSIDEIVFADYKCSIVNSIFLRYVLPEFIKNKALNIDRIIGTESDGECAPTFSSIEIAPDEKVSRLVYGNYFVSNDKFKYIIHCEEGYRDDFVFKFVSKKDATPDANILLEEFKKYGEKHNFLKGKKIDPSCNFIKFDRKFGWDDIVLSPNIKEDIRTNLLNLINSRDIYQSNGLQVKRGIILASAPGTGKSTLIKILCNQIDWSLVWVTPKHLEGGARKIAQIVQLCKDLSPSVLVLEDIDLYAGDRATNRNPALLGEMLNQLDGVQENTDIITIATTNQKDVLEKALLDRPGRFDKVIDIPLPEYNERLQMLKVFSNGLVDENLPFLNHVAKESSKKLTGAQIRELVNMSIIYAIDEKSYDENQKIILKESHFTKAIANIKNKDFSKITGFSPTGSSSSISMGSRLDDSCPDFYD